MSLPDTVFIFVLALIIFGPKKLPEIGRQIGRLVGEFRRASNEFKYQIEEELRQVEFSEKRSAPQTISQPSSEPVEPLASLGSSASSDSSDLAENLPVGQYPNIDTVDTSELNPTPIPPFGLNSSDLELENPEAGGENTDNEIAPESAVTSCPIAIAPAPGSQPRTTAPFTDSASATPSFELATAELSSEGVASADHDSARTEAEVTHG